MDKKLVKNMVIFDFLHIAQPYIKMNQMLLPCSHVTTWSTLFICMHAQTQSSCCRNRSAGTAVCECCNACAVIYNICVEVLKKGTQWTLCPLWSRWTALIICTLLPSSAQQHQQSKNVLKVNSWPDTLRLLLKPLLSLEI